MMIAEWISVKDKMPREEQKVLFITDRWAIWLGHYYKTIDVWVSDGRITIPNVTHWMALPQPPKGV